jgi:A/G-specific adenine glycosylase
MFPNVCSDDSENSDYSEPSIGATYNQAIMDFGALQCMPKSPKCDDCPLMETCDAFRTGRVEQLPVKEKKLQVKERRMTYVYIRCNGETAIHRRGAGDIWQGLWEPYSIDNLQLIIDNLQLLRRNLRHVLTHRVIWADFYLWEVEEKPVLPDDYIWIKEEEIDNYAVPRLIEILLKTLPV